MIKQWLLVSSVAFGVGFGVSLPFQRDVQQAVFSGLVAVPAAAVALTLVTRQKRRFLSHKLTLLEAQIRQLEAQKQELDTGLQADESRLAGVLQQVAVHESELSDLQSLIQAHQEEQTLEASQLADLQTQRAQQSQSLSRLEADVQAAEALLRQTQQNLESASLDRQSQETALVQLQAEWVAQKQQKAELEATISAQESRQRQIAVAIEQLKADQKHLENSINSQEESERLLSRSVKENSGQYSLKKQLINSELTEHDCSTSAPKFLSPVIDEPAAPIPPSMASAESSDTSILILESIPMQLNFTNPDTTKKFWCEELLPYWSHHDRPVGQRFMGSFRLSETATQQLLQGVGQNLQRVGSLTDKKLSSRFGDPIGYWGKIVTLAISEYAYHYSESNNGFWNGFCQKINIKNSQLTENALRTTVDCGFESLGLIRAKGGYRYVSTLWLQSGVPKQNLEHFAQLVQELQADYGWEHLAEADHTTLSEILLDTCQEKYPQWGTLKNFLATSCTDNDAKEVEPLSGQLLQGIAVVAQELERYNLSPEILSNDDEREALLSHSYLPRNFFLRSWETLTKVIQLQDNASARKRLVSCRPRKPLLELDLDSLETQLVLPEQVIWKRDWTRDLRGRYCQIPDAEWEETIPNTGGLEIPQLLIPVNGESDRWSTRLIDHNGRELHQWDYSGISPERRYLLFDASTGEHLPMVQDKIIGCSEMLCFAPKDITIEPSTGIEIREQGVPSSFRGWRGLHLSRFQSQASICLKDVDSNLISTIQWQARSLEPILQGLRLPGKQAVYIGVPILWLPEVGEKTVLNLLIENLADKAVLAKQVEEIEPGAARSLNLQQWLPSPGSYAIKLWNARDRWSFRFEVRQNHQVENPTASGLQIHYQKQLCSRLPIQTETVNEFWAAMIEMCGLWPMDLLMLNLSDGEATVNYSVQADASGALGLSLAQLYELLPSSEYYSLSYHIVGQPNQILIEVGKNSPKVELLNDFSTPVVVATVEEPSSIQPVSADRSQKSNWHFVTLKPRKRDLFMTLLRRQMDYSTYEKTGILTFKECCSDYPDHLLMQVHNFKLARQTLQGIEGFLDLQRKPLTETEVTQMEA